MPSGIILGTARRYSSGRGTGDRTATFRLLSGVALQADFPPDGGPGEERDPNTYESVFSGNVNPDDAEVAQPAGLLREPTRAENSYHVVTGGNANRSAALDGFVITAGNWLAGA